MKANHSTFANQRHGFTLIELITVVAIIAILASLILTALSRAKARVRSAQCQHNLRQQGVILASFVHDHSVYPLLSNPQFVEGGYPEHRSSWVSALFHDYGIKDWHGSRGLFDCPSANRPLSFPRDSGYSDFGYNAHGLTSKAMDLALGLGGKGNVESRFKIPVGETDVSLPAGMIAIGDGLVGWEGVIMDGTIQCGRRFQSEHAEGSTARAESRHRGKANYVFCDGHVEAVSLERLFQSKDPADLQLWNRDGKPHPERL